LTPTQELGYGNSNNPNEEEVLKPVYFIFDFAPKRALSPLLNTPPGCHLMKSPLQLQMLLRDLMSFLLILAHNGENISQVDVDGMLATTMAGNSATLLARK